MGSKLESNSKAVRKRIEGHRFEDEEGEEYKASKFGGFADYFRRKKIKLQNLDAERRSQNADKPAIFRGVVVHVNGYTQPSLNDLHTLVVEYGGGFLQYLDGKTTVTHVIASSLTPKKRVEFRNYRIVKPAWVVDSIQAGKLLPWNTYRVVDEGIRQNILGFLGGSIVSQANTQRTGYKEQTDTSWYTGQVQDFARQLGAGTVEPDLPPSGQISQYQDARETLTVPEAAHSPPRTDQTGTFKPPEQISPPNDPQSQVEGPPISPAPKALAYEAALRAGPGHERDVWEAERALSTRKSPEKGAPGKQAKTAEEHNAALLADPKIWKSTVVNPAFLKQYYEESRLHHLSTWKAELKARLQAQTASQKPRKRRPSSRRYVLHVDFDSFFAAVSLRGHPEWMDKPVVVAHGNGAGAEIASCNYPARQFGVKNGMWMKRAQEMCPELKVLPYDFQAYESTSRDFYAAIMDVGGIVQSVSIDEALVDISDICIDAGGSDGRTRSEGSVDREQAEADRVATDLRTRIREMTQCNVSVGIGGNILLAKVALRKAKPAGQYQIRSNDILDFLGPLGVQDLPGVAYSMGGKLEEMGVKLVRDLRELSKERLMTSLGPRTGEKLWEYARGVDRAEVGDQVIRKSVSAEVNWGVRFATQEQAEEFVLNLCEELRRRLLNEAVRGRQLTVKVMRKAAHVPMDPPKHLGHGPCDVFNKSVVLGVATNDGAVLAREAVTMLRGLGFPPGELRGLGVQATKLEPIKHTDKSNDSSQGRLRFKTTPAKVNTDAIEDIESPSKPVKSTRHPAASLAAPKPGGDLQNQLNTMGTQFILPSQVDPSVLAELPEDIRKRLARNDLTRPADRGHLQGRLGFQARPTSPAPAVKPPAPHPDELPPESQLDPEALAALPDDVREEVIGFYRRSPLKPNAPARTSHFPQPRRVGPEMGKKLTTPTKRRTNALGRGRPRGSKKQLGRSGLMQANFVAAKPAENSGPADEVEGEIDPDVLASLPEDIRSEVLEEQRRERLRKRGSLGLNAKRKARPPAPEVPRVVELPPRPPRPVFTANKLTALPELRDAISAWVEDFSEELPNAEDVTALVVYLWRVVVDEMDMSKAVAVVKWLEWSVGQDEAVKRLWAEAIASVKDGVQAAVKERGLGEFCF